jgi:peroxiredoxin
MALPPTRLTRLDGSPTDLPSALGGRAALVSFWATWCTSCVDEIESLERLDARIRTRGDAIVVAVAVGETPQTVAAFARERGITYALLVDEDFQLADALGQRRVPATLVVAPGGRIVHRAGALDADSLMAFRAAMGASGKPVAWVDAPSSTARAPSDRSDLTTASAASGQEQAAPEPAR